MVACLGTLVSSQMAERMGLEVGIREQRRTLASSKVGTNADQVRSVGNVEN